MNVGIEGYFTNHSLRHMCASLLFNDEEYIPEQVIAEQTGHHSLAIRKYKHMKPELKCKVSNILTDGPTSAKTSSVVSSTDVDTPNGLCLFKNSELKAMQLSQKSSDDCENADNVKRIKLDIMLSLKDQ